MAELHVHEPLQQSWCLPWCWQPCHNACYTAICGGVWLCRGTVLIRSDSYDGRTRVTSETRTSVTHSPRPGGIFLYKTQYPSVGRTLPCCDHLTLPADVMVMPSPRINHVCVVLVCWSLTAAMMALTSDEHTLPQTGSILQPIVYPLCGNPKVLGGIIHPRAAPKASEWLHIST